jgi:N-acyl-L-homoserine lactone synthetase
MHNICCNFSNFHRYGPAFYDFLALRKRVFVDQLGWDVPHDAAVEMDQYDTPLAQYSLVLRNGKVLGGARAMATTAAWGAHTYMLRDAYSGKLPHIPPHVMSVEIASPQVWECTRLVIADALTTAVERSECLRLIVDGLVEITQAQGGKELICLSSLALMRALRQLGYEVTRLGDTYRNDEDGRQYAVLRMPAEFARTAPIPFPQARGDGLQAAVA